MRSLERLPSAPLDVRPLLVAPEDPDGLGLYDAWIGGPIAERDFTMRLCDQTSWASTAPITERCDAW